VPVCTQPGCPELLPRYGYCAGHRSARDKVRNADPRRRALYDAEWTRHSRERRVEQPWCLLMDETCKGALSVDHPTDDVLCLSHHDRIEARRRATAISG